MTLSIVRLSTLFPIIMATSLGATAVQAEEPTTDNAQQRINLSGKLRMLSQRIPSAACHLHQDIAAEDALATLSASTSEFEQILAALEFGDDEINITDAETHRKTLARIAELRAVWEPLAAATHAVIDGTASENDLNFVLTHNLSVLQAAQLLVEALVHQYANPMAATKASLLLIDIAGRQRMLIQKMSKQSCMIESGFGTEEFVDDLASTKRIFEASLEALQFGMPAAGILPPPNNEIFANLDHVSQDWAQVEPHIASILSGNTLDPVEDTAKFHGMNVALTDMDIVVGMYAAARR